MTRFSFYTLPKPLPLPLLGPPLAPRPLPLPLPGPPLVPEAPAPAPAGSTLSPRGHCPCLCRVHP